MTAIQEGRSELSSLTEPRRFGSRFVIWLLLFLVAAGGLVAASVAMRSEDTVLAAMKTEKVKRGELVISLTEDGTVESAVNTEVKCRVAGGSTILEIVEDGKEVKQGDLLVRLDSSLIEDQIDQQKITYEKAISTVIQAEKNYEVAKISVTEYLEGSYTKLLQDAESAITIALENQRGAQNSLEHAERMFRKGYISPLELESQQFAVQRAQLDLDSANTAKEVLQKFTKVKMLQELESLRETAKAAMESEKAAFELEKSRLERLQEQLKNCEIYAPQDGMVVYANDRSAGRRGPGSSSGQSQIEEGAAVREQQDILKLPNLSQMQVKVAVHESKVDMLKTGTRARINILGKPLQGTLTKVANQPEPSSSFFGTSVKEYAAIVTIDGQPKGLKPGMTAEVEILIEHNPDALSIPVTAVVEKAPGKFFCWVQTSKGTEQRPLLLGLSNDKEIQVNDGVVEGELVVVNPRAVIPEAREVATDTAVSVREIFGDTASTPSAAAVPQDDAHPGVSESRPPEEHDAAKGGAAGQRAEEGRGRFGSGGPKPEGSPDHGREGRGSGGPRGNLMEMDQNGDGKISRDEVPSERQRIFDFMDENGDDVIEQQEIEAARARRAGPGGAGGGRAQN